MQVDRDVHFAKRAMYYSAKSYVGQIKSGDQYQELKPVVFLGILDFNVLEGINAITRHLLINQSTTANDLRDFEFNFIELPKFIKIEGNLESETDFWLDFFKTATSRESPPAKLPASVAMAYESASQYKWNQEERDIYDAIAMKTGVQRNVTQQAIEAAERTAEAKGKATGKAEGKAEMIHALHAHGGMSTAQIAAIAGLPMSDVLRILDEK